MKSKDYQYTPKNRRGLSSIVGALLFVVLMVATFSVLGIALNSQTNIASTGRDVADLNLKQQQEDFVINSILQESGELLVINATNKGQNVAEIFTIVITNKTDAGEPTQTYSIPSVTSFLAPGDDESTDIVETLDLNMTLAANPGDPDRVYDIKVISSLGTIKQLKLFCNDVNCGSGGVVGTGDLQIQIFLDGPTGINTKTSTIIMLATNNGDAKITNVIPDFLLSPDCENILFSQTGSGTADFTECEFESTSPVTLVPGQTSFFIWDGKITGEVGDVLTFCNNASGLDPTPIVGEPLAPDPCDTLEIIDPNDCGLPDCGGGGDEDILDEKFITRPELFLTIPSPFGGPGIPIGGFADPDRALWGANVVNPTDTTMFIHKITITAFPPAANKNFLVIASGNDPQDCSPRDISPGNGTIPGSGNAGEVRDDEAGFWTCPGQNTIMWRNYATPIILPPLSTFPFLVQLESDRPISNVAESVLVDSTVYTTSGSFGKGNYQSTAYPIAMYANVFATTDWLDGVNRDKIISSYSGILSGSVQRFSVVFTDFDTDPLTYIEAGSKIVVNVPRAFKDVIVIDAETSNPGILIVPGIEPTVVIHPDETTQIIATVPDRIGDVTGIEYVVLTFEALAPTVTTNKLMVMYTLANGLGSSDSSVGPLTEIVLQVIP